MLTDIRINGFRSCYQTAIDSLGPGPTALVGRNGAGKTNVLRAIEFAAKSAAQPDGQSRRVGIVGAGNSAHITLSFKIHQITGSYRVESLLAHASESVRTSESGKSVYRETLSYLEGDANEIEISRENSRVVIQANGSQIAELSIGHSSQLLPALLSLLPPEDGVLDALRNIHTFFGSIAYYSDSIHSYRSGRGGAFVEAHLYDEWKNSYEETGDFPSATSFKLIYLWQEDPDTFRELVDLLGDNGLGLVSDISIREHTINASGPHGVSGDDKNDSEDKMKLFSIGFKPGSEVAGGMGGHRVVWADLSQGTQRVIRLLAVLLFDKRSVFLLEQPEDSLHPILLQRLLDIIIQYSELSQVIFSTHSPDVLDALSPEQLRLVTWEEDSTKCRRLIGADLDAAHSFLSEEGSLSDFVDTLEF